MVDQREMTSLTVSPARMSTTRWLALAGMIGPVLTVVLWAVVDIVQYRFLIASGNDPLVTSPSSVNALGPYGWIQDLSFIFLGLSIVALALGLHRVIAGGTMGMTLLIGVGITMILTGIFTEDSVHVGNPTTFHGLVHDLSFFAFLLLQTGMYFFMWRRFRKEASWRGYGRYSFAAGVAVLPLFVALNIVLDSHDGFYLWLLLVPYAWFEVMALRLWAVSRGGN